MAARKSAARGGTNRSRRAKLEETAEDNQEQQPQDEEHQIDHSDEQIMTYEEHEEHEKEDEEEDEEDDDDDQEEECHYLISGNSQGGSHQSKLLASGSHSGKQSPNISLAAYDMEPRNPLSRLASYLSRPFYKSKGGGAQAARDTSFDDMSTSDFVYNNDRLPAYYYEGAGREEDSSAGREPPSFHSKQKQKQKQRQQQQHHKNKRNNKHYANHTNHSTQSLLHSRSHLGIAARPLLMIMLFLVLILSTLSLLLRLLSLVQDERTRLLLPSALQDSADGVSSSTSPKRQDSVLFEISRKLDEAHRKQLELEHASRWLVSSSKCHIPVLDAWHESIKGYVHRKPAMNCNEIVAVSLREAEEEEAAAGSVVSKPRKKLARRLAERFGGVETLTYVEGNKLYFTPKALALGALQPIQVPKLLAGTNTTTMVTSSQCCFKRVSREIGSDDKLEYATACTPIVQQGLFVNSSIIELTCAGWNYTNVHAFMLHDQEEEHALRGVAASKLDEKNYYNVLMLGVDTISRLNGLRQLNRTLALLERLYGSLDFVGYNKVGENTFPNLIPLLTGLKPEQLTEVQCWLTKNYSQETERGDDYLDNCKYLWNYYQQVGYATYFSEDWPSASTFNYLKPGFKNEPTTYYGRPFTLARDKLTFPKFKAIGCASCQLDRPIVDVDMANLATFVRDMSANQMPYFAFHWINCPQHDDLNGASQVDAILEKFFIDLHKLTQDQRTFVIFFSDHGYRWNDFVSTRIGHYESSLPLLTIAPPRHFIENHPQLYERLRSHQSSLLTPFDIFKTLIDLRDMSSKVFNRGKWNSSSSSPLGAQPPMPPMSERARRQLSPIGSTLALLTESALPGAITDSSLAAMHPDAPEAHPTDEPPVDVAKSLARQRLAAEAEATSQPSAVAVVTAINEIKPLDGTSYVQKFKTLSLFDEHTKEELDRSCIEAGIPDNYCVCQQFQPLDANRTEVLGAAYYLVYAHLEANLRAHLQLCHPLELEHVHHAEVYNFEQVATTTTTTTTTTSKPDRRRRQSVAKKSSVIPSDDGGLAGANRTSTKKTTPKPALNATDEPATGNKRATPRDKKNYLPNREYSVMFSTSPGGGLFQEVVRFYGADMAKCEVAILKARKVIEDKWAIMEDKRTSVQNMNRVCEFSVHSESLSRFNLYKDQSKCVTSNIELKKICYCNDLL